MKTWLALLVVCASLACAREQQSESKPLVLPTLPAPQSPTKAKVSSDCTSDKPVLPGKSGFEKCSLQDPQLREGPPKR